jgi:hypothetical protein
VVVAVRQRSRLSEAQTRDLRVRQSNLTALTQHHSWAALIAEVEKRQAYIEKTIARSILRGPEDVYLSPEKQAYLRGFAAGMRWFAAAPEQAEGALERFLKTHGITTMEESDAA